MNESAAHAEGRQPDNTLSDVIAGTGSVVETLSVALSNEVVHLLSEQLYTSPLKAIEELVVNAYDADARECRIGLILDQPDTGQSSPPIAKRVEPGGNSNTDAEDQEEAVGPSGVEANEDTSDNTAPSGLIAIYDDGVGMDVGGLRDLWRIGDSPKKRIVSRTTPGGRLIIGKFGIGKLATYAIANRITYLTTSAGTTHHVICDFRQFGSDPSGTAKPVRLSVRKIDNLEPLLAGSDFAAVLTRLGLDVNKLTTGANSWTLCILDKLKPKARELKIGRLSWVVRTAMPLRSDFGVFINGVKQESSKENIARPIVFKPQDLEEARLKRFNEKFRVDFIRSDKGLIEEQLFPSGIRGEIFVAEKSLVGKADMLLGRSNGFFVRVRDRLVNTEDKLFHNTPLSFETFNRFRADLEIDDLHNDVTAPREGVEAGRRRAIAAAMARELFNQARDQFQAWLKSKHDPKKAPEHERAYVAPRLVKRPVADALAMYGSSGSGAEADSGWFYMSPLEEGTLTTVIQQLYSARTRY